MRVVQSVLCICIIFGLVACDHRDNNADVANASEAVIESPTALPSAEPSALPGTSIEVKETAVDPLGDLQLRAESTGDGFQIVDSNGVYLGVEMTFVSPSSDGKSYGVHIVNRSDEHGFRKDAIVVNPRSKTIEGYPLYRVNANQDSLFILTSIAKVFGFVDDRNLLYISALDKAERNEGYDYRLETLDIVTGKRNILMSLDLNLAEMPYMTASWLSSAKNKIFMNTPPGASWTIDYNEREIEPFPESLENPMPFNNMYRSPDGERFWLPEWKTSEYRLYDLQGRMLSQVPREKGYSQYSSFQWSPDSKYSVHQSTRDQSEDHVISQGGDFAVIAPQIIQLFDRQGTLLRSVETKNGSGRYIEFAGWLDGTEGTIVLREYDLDRSFVDHPVKQHTEYRLLNIRSGEEQPLRIADDITLLENPVPALLSSYNFLSSIVAVDTGRSLLAVVAEYGTWISGAGDDRTEWIEIDRTANSAAYHVFDEKTKRSAEKEFNHYFGESNRIGEEWLQSGTYYGNIKPQQ